MSSPYWNNLQLSAGSNKLCKAFGIKICSNAQVVQYASNAGFEALFLDLEHGWLSHEQAQNLCVVALATGITPLVRVPYQCGYGFVQRVLDGGAMGIIIPHVHSREDAESAVKICKYPGQGVRSMAGGLALFASKSVSSSEIIEATNKLVSVLVMVESGHGVDHAEEIAAVEGVSAIVIGSSDLSIDLGVPSQWNSNAMRSAYEKVSAACRKHGKIFGLAGVYGNPDFQDWAINKLGARFILAEQDVSLLAAGAEAACKAVPLPSDEI